MTQYLLSVWHDADYTVDFSGDDAQRMFAQVARFNDELEAAGSWVFGGGLEPAHTATVVRPTGDVTTGIDTTLTDGPYAETKEVHGRLLGHRGRRPRRCARLGPQGLHGVRRPGRGAPLPGRVSRARSGRRVERSRRRRPDLPRGVRARRRPPGPTVRRHLARRGGRAGRVRPRQRALAGRRRAAQPGRVDHHHRPQSSARHRAARVDPHPALHRCLPRHHPLPRHGHRRHRRVRQRRRDQRRPAPADLHVLPPGARARDAGGAHPAPARRAADRRDREGVPRARAHDGAAAGPRQEEDPGRQHPVPRARGRRPARAPRRRARSAVPGVQRGLLRQQRRLAAAPRPRPTRRCASLACWWR